MIYWRCHYATNYKGESYYLLVKSLHVDPQAYITDHTEEMFIQVDCMGTVTSLH